MKYNRKWKTFTFYGQSIYLDIKSRGRGVLQNFVIDIFREK